MAENAGSKRAADSGSNAPGKSDPAARCRGLC
jgi:hypothetical protein